MIDYRAVKTTVKASVLIRSGVPSAIAHSVAPTLSLGQCHAVERAVEEGAPPTAALTMVNLAAAHVR